jgi:peptidyl-dipeptidase A
MSTDAVVAEVIEALQEELEPLERQANEAEWQLNVTGEERWEQERARLRTEIRTILSRPEPYRILREGAENERVQPALRRQALLLANQHAPHQIPVETIETMVSLEGALTAKFSNFRAELDGEHVSDNRIREVLDKSNDLELRQRAWEASKQIGAQVAPELIELVRVRNEAARGLGFTNYYSMMLELDELEENELFDLIDRVVEGSQEPFELYKRDLDEKLAERFGVDIPDLRPWHYADPWFQTPPRTDLSLDPWFEGCTIEHLVAPYFDGIGFDVRPVLARSDLYEREGKCQHAFCTDIDRRGDVRVLCNLRANEFWAGVLLHELGHAVYDEQIDQELPYFVRTQAHYFVTEASAMLFGRLTRSPAWLVRYVGMPEDEARAAETAIADGHRARLLHVARAVPLFSHMERALYQDPEQDLNTLWWDLVERFQLLTRPDDRDGPDWAAKIHFSAAPVYFQNYLLGEMTASQLQAWLLDSLGDGREARERYVQSPEVGELLSERLYRLGRSVDWRGAIANATGGPLDPAPFLGELAASVAPLR